MHYFYIISYYLILYITSLIIGAQIVEFKPKRKWPCLAMILGILMLPITILCFTNFFETGYEALPIYFFAIYIVCFIPIVYGTVPGDSKPRFVSYIYNWFLLFVVSYFWNISISVGVSAFVALFIPTVIPVRALFSFSEIYELILLLIIDIFTTVTCCFILRNLIKIFKKRIVFLLTNFLFLIPCYIPILRKLEFNQYTMGDYLSIILMILSFPITLLIVFITIRINDMIQIKKQYFQIEEEYKKQFEIYEKYTAFFEESRRFRHDLVNHLSVLSTSIKDLTSNDKINLANEKEESIISDTRKINIIEYQSVSPVLNALFSIKEQYAKERNIDIIYQIALPEKININNYDLVGIISNLLDNSIEACEKITDREKKKDILLKIFNKNGFLCINISNSFNPIDNPINTNFITTKNNSIEHGFGSHIISSIVKKYNGYCKIINESEKIIINIALNNS